MADTNIGFDVQNGILESDWAVVSPHLGSTLATVESEGSRKVTASSANPGTVDVAAGVSYAFGERRATDVVTNKPIQSVTLAGAIRWDAIVERRNWSTNSVTVEVVPGTASVNAPEVAPTLNAQVGILHDTLLALVRATQGTTSLYVSDKRVWASKVFTVQQLTGLPPATPALHGAVCYVIETKTVYRCLLVSGSPGWVTSTPTRQALTGTDLLSPASGWSLASSSSAGAALLPSRGLYDPSSGLVQLDLQLRRASGTLSPYNSGGGLPVTPIGTLTGAAAQMCPDADVNPMPLPAQYATGSGSANSWRGAQVTLSAAGELNLIQIGSDDLAPVTSGLSLRMHLLFSKRI